MLQGKRILLGISGGIAAYKIAFLVRILKKLEAEVKVIMTPASSDFISPLVLSTLSKNEVGIEFWDKKTGVWTNHVEYGLWADLFVIAPLTANTLAKMANGSSDNLLLATYLSMKCPTIVAPAMDLDMYRHPTTQHNLKLIASHGVKIIPAESGELASGLEGEGRMAEPETIAKVIETHFASLDSSQALRNKTVLITAGPTYELIDPVRFVGNFSTGKMGYALAEKCLKEGAQVILISGPSNLNLEHDNLRLFRVKSATEMFDLVKTYWTNVDMGIFSAAVADFRPDEVAGQKIKKEDTEFVLKMVKNPDLLYWAGEHKKDAQFLVGFALETNNPIENAKVKLKKKNLDFIVVNTLEDEGAGFAGDTNKIAILDKHNNLTRFELKSKSQVADDIVNHMINFK